MKVINERQQIPYAFSCVMVLIIIAGSYLVTRIVDPAPAVSNNFYWYMARSAGFTAYGLLSVAVLLGASASSGLWDRWKIRKLMTQMHQYAALLVAPFLFFHLWGLHQDTTVPFRWLTLLVPFLNKYRPISTGFGILTLYGGILLIVTSYFREKLSMKTWRTIHYASFPMFILVTLHGLFSGTDTGKLWTNLIYLVPTALFIVLVLNRFRSNTKAPSRGVK